MPSIKKNFLYSSILTSANYLFPLLTFPYVSRVLGVTNIGIVNFVDSVIHYFILISMMGINIVGIREIAKEKWNRDNLSKTFNELFWLNTITTSIALFILVILTLLVDQIRFHWQMMILGALKLIMNYMLIEWLYKGLEDFKYITIRTLIIKLLYVIFVFLFVRKQSDYLIYYFLSVLMIVANSVVNLYNARKYIYFKWKNINLWHYLPPFFTLGIYNLLNSMYISVNVTWLGLTSGETEVGYYTTASKIYGILIALFSAFTGVMLPRMSSLISEGEFEKFTLLLKKTYKLLFALSIPFVIFFIIYAPVIIFIISGPGYEGAIFPMRIMMPLMLIIGYEQILVIQTLMPLKKDGAILRNSIVGAFAGLILNILLVSTFASVGASLVWIGSEVVVLCSAQYYVKKYINMGFPWCDFIKTSIIYLPLLISLYLLYKYINIWYSFIFSIILLGGYVIVFNTLIVPNKEIIDIMCACKKNVSKWIKA